MEMWVRYEVSREVESEIIPTIRSYDSHASVVQDRYKADDGSDMVEARWLVQITTGDASIPNFLRKLRAIAVHTNTDIQVCFDLTGN